MSDLRAQLTRWRNDPVAFVDEALVNPETGQPFVLYPAEERFLREVFTLMADGRLRYPESIYSAPKKSGKSTFAAMCTLYTTLVLGGRFAEAYCVANDFEQAQSRVFRAAARILEASPLLRRSVQVLQNRIEFPGSGATITVLASEYAGAAGPNPVLTVFDELWGYTSERSRRLWDELVPVPTRPVSMRLTVSYAGFEGESELLWTLYQRGLTGEQIAPALYRLPGEMLMYWSHVPVAPWQTGEWVEQMRRQLRPNAFLRMVMNQFTAGEEAFVPIEWWDACVDSTLSPIFADGCLPIWVGVDASTKRDSTAILACTWDATAKKVRVVTHRIFTPSPDDPLDFQATVVATLVDWQRRFRIREVRFDPYQMTATAQELGRNGLPMVEFPQSLPNLTEASTNLYDLLKGRNLVTYPDADIRLAIQRAVAVETSRGWRLTKEKAVHKIDVVTALAIAALAVAKEPAPVRPAVARIPPRAIPGVTLGPGWNNPNW